MTRRVRSGSSQKHKKMPGNATKWGEFDCQKTSKSSDTKQDKNEDLKLEQSSNAVCVNSSIFPVHENTVSSFEKSKKKKRKENKSALSSESQTKDPTSGLDNDFESKTIFDNSEQHENVTKHPNFKQNSKVACANSSDSPAHENTDSSTVKTKSKKQKRKKNKSVIPSESETKEITFGSKGELEYETPSDKVSSPDKSFMKKNSGLKKNKKENNKQNLLGSPNSSADEVEKASSPKNVKTKKEEYLKKLQWKRKKMGLILLPDKVERRLRNIRKRLQEKNYPPEQQKEILRKERRKEELKFRKTINPSKLCFHCREPGHLFADCPKRRGESNQETGICFKCGSSEHTSFKCSEKVQGFPFAKCFICKEQGHISKDCPQNKHGVYPKGGRCNLCGNVNHLKKDCPSLKKKVNDESSITLHTINEATSVDAEEVIEEETKKSRVKRLKLVKF